MGPDPGARARQPQGSRRLDGRGSRYAFVFMLAFDTWIGNGDRHQENWAVIVPDPNSGSEPARLAPMFDPAACLGVELGDSHRALRPGADLAGYIRKCPSGFGDGTKGLRLSQVFDELCRWPEWTDNVRSWLAAFDDSMNTVNKWLDEAPADWLPDPRKDLARRLLAERLRWMKEHTP